MDTPTVNKKESDVFSTIGRIQKKIGSLRDVLSPVISESPAKVSEQGYGTKLSNDLHDIENNLTTLLDSINI